MMDWLKKSKVGAILGDKKIKDKDKEKLIEIAISNAVIEQQNGLMFLACALAKGISTELLNKMFDDKSISNEAYNKYRDLILDELVPDKCEIFINDFYLDGEKRWEKAKAEKEKFDAENPTGIKGV